MVDLVVRAADAAALLLPSESDRAKAYAAAGINANTRRAYDAQWRRFVAWARARGLEVAPAEPDTVMAYIADMADRGLKPATIDLALVAIAQAHQVLGLESPREHPGVRQTRRGIRRVLRIAQDGKAPLLSGALRVALATLPLEGDRALRDRALLLVGWSGALRRSELIGLNVDDVRFKPRGLEVQLRRSKTDQDGVGRPVPIARQKAPELCPASSLRTWLDAAAITEGAIFRSLDRWGHLGPRLTGHAVAEIVKAAAARAGLEPGDFGAHSLRSGFITDAARRGVSEAALMRITGHRSVAMLRRYIKEISLWDDVASEGLLDP